MFLLRRFPRLLLVQKQLILTHRRLYYHQYLSFRIGGEGIRERGILRNEERGEGRGELGGRLSYHLYLSYRREVKELSLERELVKGGREMERRKREREGGRETVLPSIPIIQYRR